VTSVEWVWVAVAIVVGIAAGPPIRAALFHYAVPIEDSWRTNCPDCDTSIVRPGWLTLASTLPPSGRCAHCDRAIGPPAGVVELLAAATLGVLVWWAGPAVATVGLAWAALVAITLALVDVAVHRLPDRLILAALSGTALIFVIAAVASGDYHRLGIAALCALGCGALYFVIVFLSPRGMGLGDAKLAVLVGLSSGWFGVRATVLAVFAGVIYAGLVAIALLALRRVSRSDRLAYGPFMLLGALTAIVLANV
jgi:leader peptidase (prepilin peptidase)/N-methyltransferase